jgi:alpha-L-fucosidase
MMFPEPTVGDSAWFTESRFGMFIHWGLYALPARHEWVKSHEEISDERYQRYFDHFNPDLFNPREWARQAREAGMKYVVVTTKHHEGFCLWDSAHTDYKATNTPYGKDLLLPIVQAFRDEGLRIGFYYSLIDWHHPDFTLDLFHPQRNTANAEEFNQGRDMRRYAAYMRSQMEELLTKFGQIDVLWCDFSYPGRDYKGMPGKGNQDWESAELYRLIRELMPNVMLNNRLDLVDLKADFYTPEQFQPTQSVEVDGKRVVWEACQTFSGSWGYHRDETTWKSPEQLIQMLVQTVSLGGNLLMNVGPTGRGIFDQRAIDALGVYRDWMQLHSRAIYGCTESPFKAPSGVCYTQKGNRLYAHLFNYPFRHLQLPHLAGRVDYAQFLNDGSEILFKEAGAERGWDEEAVEAGSVMLYLPVVKPPVVVPVIEIFLK